MAKYITYDKKYSLKNFVPEIKNDEQIVVGTGSYGKVYLYRNIIDKKLYAIKHMDKYRLNKALKSLSGIYDEIFIQSRIFHQNIVRLLYVKENSETFDLIMEYADGGSLFYYIRDKRYLSERESFHFFSQIINAVYFLHKNDLIHRDIKPENILLYDNKLCKLCDFGWCVKLEGKQRTTFCGTTEYMSPEIVNKVEYSKEIDIWSLGILLYEMVHGYSPFRPNKDEFDVSEVIDNIKIHDLKFNINISSECRDLIRHLLDENVENRYKIEDIFNSKFVKKYENKKLYFPLENIKMKNDIKSPIKMNENKKCEKEINGNNLTIDFHPKAKLKSYNSQKILPTFLKNVSMTKEAENNKIKDINIEKNVKPNKNQNNNLLSDNKIKENSNHNSISLENNDTIKKEKISNLNNNLNLTTSASFTINNNCKKRKVNLSEQKAMNNKESKAPTLNSHNINIKNKNLKNENLNLNNIINIDYFNKIKSMNNSSYKEFNDLDNENKMKKLNITSRFVNKNIYTNFKNKRKPSLNNIYPKYKNKKKNDTDDIPFATVKKLSNDNDNNDSTLKKKRIINFNNYLTTYRENKRKQYEKITVFNNTQKCSFSDRDSNGPKDNLNPNSKLSINISHSNNNNNIYKTNNNTNLNTCNNTNINTCNNINNNSSEQFTKRKIVNTLRLGNYSNNRNILKHYKIPSIENSYRLNSEILKSERIINSPKNRMNINKNPPLLDKNQANDNLNRTFRSTPNNNLFKNNYSSFLNNYEKPQINTNYIFNPKISITLPSNSANEQKSNTKKNNPRKNYKIIYLGNNLDTTNLKNLKNLTKSQSFLKTNFLNINNKKITDNNMKFFRAKDKEMEMEMKKESNLNSNNSNNKTTRKKIYGTLNKKDGYDTPRFNTEREKDKKLNMNLNLNMDSLFKGTESAFLKNKKYIKMNEIEKYKNINDNNHKSISKAKKQINDDINENQKLIQPKKINKEKDNNNNLSSRKKINYKIKINNTTNNDNKIKSKSKEKNLFKNSYSERDGYMSNDKGEKSMRIFSARNFSKSKSKKMMTYKKLLKKWKTK